MVDYVSNGAYVLKEYKEKTSATLEANPNFYLGEPKTKNLIFKVVATNAELQAVETGDVDITIRLSAMMTTSKKHRQQDSST